MGKRQLKQSAPREDDFLSERSRAEDVLLGSLGFGEEARIVSVEVTDAGYRGMGQWIDGEQFEFESTDEIDELQRWALAVFSHNSADTTAARAAR